ncbi:MAG: DUF4157 domain-containing protein [Ardenticatenaceae bacterium]|nr:DUF4157 domain-containing protein [Ardenticatenaceae bacterium]
MLTFAPKSKAARSQNERIAENPNSSGFPQNSRKILRKSSPTHKASPHDLSFSSTGQPLEAQTREWMESRFGYNFGEIRIHSDAEATKAADQLGADAFTIGQDIYFRHGKYRPSINQGRQLIAHELVHTIQNKSSNHLLDEYDQNRSISINEKSGTIPLLLPSRNPDVISNGYQSFYVDEMFQRPGTQVRVQFYQDSADSSSATLAVWYEETGTMQRVSFSTSSPISPVLLDEALGVVYFDLNGDGLPDIIIQASPERGTGGLIFQANLNGQNVLTMTARPNLTPPPLPPRVPTGARLVGTLPNGRDYYVLPYTASHPAGPFYVDEEGNGVNPALEHQAAATLEGIEQGLLIGAAALLVVGTAGVAAELGVGAAAGSAVLRFLFSGRSLVAGGTSAGANLVTQAMAYGTEWEQYNWPSVGFDYVLGIISYRVAAGVFERWPAPIFSSSARNLTTWTNFGRQQAVFGLYGTVVGLLRANISNTSGGSTVAAQHTSGAVQMVKSGAMQTFLLSPFGRAHFPEGMRDPRIIFINRLLSLILNVAVREVFGVVPGQAEQESAEQ